MKLAVLGSDESFHALIQGATTIEWTHTAGMEEAANLQDMSGFFNLRDDAGEADYAAFSIPVFANSVSGSLHGQKHLTRINAWKGFLENNTWEIAGNYNEPAKAILKELDKKIIVTADVPGFISGSIIAMIINEAYFAKAENVSTEAEIDLAMKLGTNYPYGPFEWANRIGVKRIYELLSALSIENKKYTPAPLLAEATILQ